MNYSLSSNFKWVVVCVCVLGSTVTSAKTRKGLDLDTEIRPFAVDANAQHGLAIGMIEALLSKARIEDKVLKSISRPAETLLWRDYRKIFLTSQRIAAGVKFWQKYTAVLSAAAKQYAVPAEIITAIIGVETMYGRHKGKIRVLDALATLGFRYPKRGAFFRTELMHYLLLVDSEGLDPLTLQGSYAGAIGIPQFIPSSYRNYAVDFDNNQVRDLVHSEADAIGSVANYLARHGWRIEGNVAEVVSWNNNTSPAELLQRGLKPHTRISALQQMGVEVSGHYPSNPLASVIVLEGEQGVEYWLGMNNFYVITRYNHSPLYAMAVYQLAAAIKAKMSEAN